jgi:hypothetical protein
MRWYCDNGSVLLVLFMAIIFLGYWVIKEIGPLMGTETKTEKNSK